MSEVPRIEIRLAISRDQAEDFLYRATHDPEFRARVEADPGGVLREYGVEVSDELLPHLAQLPDPEDIESLRKQLQAPGEYEPAGAARVAWFTWFMVITWFVNVPGPGGRAAD